MLKNFLKFMDKYPQNLSLTYKGKRTYATPLGGILTIVSVFLILFNGWLIGNDILYREKPIVFSSNEALTFYPNATISYDKFFLALFVSDTLNNPFDDETVLKIVPQLYINYYENGTLKYEEKILELVPCNDVYKNKSLKSPLGSSIMEPLKCLKNFNEKIGGFWTVEYLSYIIFKVYSCNNNTLKEGDKTCKSQEEIETILPTLFFNIFYPKVLVDIKNYTNPMITQIYEDWYILGSTIFKTIDYYLEKTIIKTDDGIIFSNEADEISQISYMKNLNDYRLIDRGDNYKFVLSFYLSNQINTYRRSYIKLQNIFANLGGIIQSIFLIFEIIFSRLLSKNFHLKIINHLFDFELESEKNNANISRFPIKVLTLKAKKQFSKELENKFKKKYLSQLNKLFTYTDLKNNSGGLSLEGKPQSNNYSSHFFNDPHLLEGINNIVTMKNKKLRYSKSELFSTVMCIKLFRSKEIIEKDIFYEKALENVNKYTDYLTVLKNIQDFIKFKYVILNEHQILSFPYLSKPKMMKNYTNDNMRDYSKSFEFENDHKSNIKGIYKYFSEKLKNSTMDQYDNKIFDVLDQKIKNLIIDN